MWTLSRSFTNISAERPSPLSPRRIATGPSNDTLSHHEKTLQKPTVSQRSCTFFLVTHQAHVPQNKQHAALHRSVHTHFPQNATRLHWREASIKTEPHWLCIYILLKIHCSIEHIYDPPNAHEHKVDPVIHYILHSGSKKRKKKKDAMTK